MRVRELFEHIDNQKLVLPDFQRAFEWKEDNQRSLLASFFTSLPIGGLLILNGSSEDFAAKRLGFQNKNVTPREECLYLLDGQQRVTTLKCVFDDIYMNGEKSWEETFDELFYGVQLRWFIRVKPAEGEDDIFGWHSLRFYVKNLNQYEPQEIREFFVAKRIYKTRPGQWHHPGYSVVDDTGNQLTGGLRANAIAKEAAAEYLVPLWSVYNSQESRKPLHVYVIDKIAQDRLDELKAEVDQGKRTLEELLAHIEPDIDALAKQGDTNAIENAWHSLRSNWSTHIKHMLTVLLEQNIPVIAVPSSQVSRAIAIFESINRGGTPLDAFDLVVARAARTPGYESLSSRISNWVNEDLSVPLALIRNLRKPPSKWNPTLMDVFNRSALDKTFKQQYLNLLSLLVAFSKAESERLECRMKVLKRDLIKRAKILDLDSDEINDFSKEAVEALIRACLFLQVRCGLRSIREIPYKLMLLPIAFSLDDSNIWNNDTMLDRIEYWYWSSIFSGAYRENQNERCIKDIKNLYLWLQGYEDNEEVAKLINRKSRVFQEDGYSDKDTLLNIRDDGIPKAIHSAVIQYILSRQPEDLFASPKVISAWSIAEGEVKVEEHHLIPLLSARSYDESTRELRKQKGHILNSVLNLTIISREANRAISGKSISEYMNAVANVTKRSHLLPVASAFYYQADKEAEVFYKEFLCARYQELEAAVIDELNRLIH